MAEIKLYGGPDPDESNPSRERLKTLVLETDEDYWQRGSGELALQFNEGGRQIDLILTLEEWHGIHLQYVPAPGDCDWYVAINDEASEESVSVYIGGQKHQMPAYMFVPRQDAWRAVEQFLEDGSRTKDLKWARLSELGWPYDIDD